MAVGAALVFPSLAAVCAADEQVAFSWPERGALPVEYKHVEITGDGVIAERISLKGRNLNLRFRFLRNWVALREPPPEYSFVLQPRHQPKLFLAIAQFSRDRFFRDITDESWTAYKKGLAQEHGEALEILEETHRTGFGQGIAILGESNRSILYRLRGNGGNTLRLEFFLFHRDQLLAIRFHGPEDLVRNNEASIKSLLTRMASIREP
ncbi:MAG: hypothetical protein ACLFUF_04350 [Opitutales bacterium]